MKRQATFAREAWLVLWVLAAVPLLPVLFVLCAVEGMTGGRLSRALEGED